MKTRIFITIAFIATLMVWACGGKTENNPDADIQQEEDVNAFSAEALAEIVDYQRQKSSPEGSGEYNPWSTYGLKEIMDDDLEDVSEEDFEYADEGEEGAEEGQFEDASDSYEAEDVVYFLGHNVEFKLKNRDISDFKKKGEDAVAVVDRLDNNKKQIDILIFNKATYDEFVKKSKDQVRYQKQEENLFVAKADSAGKDVMVKFAGPFNGGYLLSIFNK